MRLVALGRYSCPVLVDVIAIHRPGAKLQRRRVFSEAVARRVKAMTDRHDKVVEQLNEGSGDIASLGKEMSSLAQVASLAKQLSSLEEEAESIQHLLSQAENENDSDMMEICKMELEGVEEKRKAIESRVLYAVLPQDEDDYRSDAVLEIRAGTGGDEVSSFCSVSWCLLVYKSMTLFVYLSCKAALFAGELLEAYCAAATSKGWKFDRLSQTKTDLGGIREAAVTIIGSSSHGFSASPDDGELEEVMSNFGPYGHFRFESGVHRVQRVPVNDSRLQTSACSVAVLPSPTADSTDPTSLLPTSELKIETMRSSGAGGQHVNTTDSAVRITHIPTGITATIQDERSQHKNKAKALKLITARVRDRQRENEQKERGDARKGLMGGGDRSERIRTYNYPQDRVTDHRCKHSENGIAKLFGEGRLVQAFAPPMRIMHREELMKQIEED